MPALEVGLDVVAVALEDELKPLGGDSGAGVEVTGTVLDD